MNFIGGFLVWTLHLLKLSKFLRKMQKKIKMFMIKLLITFSTMIGTVRNEMHPSFWHSVDINDTFCCPSPSMRDIFDWHTGFCSNSSSWLALCIILLCFFKHWSMLQVDPPTPFYNFLTFFQTTKTQLVNF